jgi:hypothetical protein
MTTPVTWPLTLPARPNAPGFGIDPALNSELFQPDNGIKRGRRRAESLPDGRRLSFDLTRAEYEDWLAFYRTDLKGGYLPIRFVDPVSGGNLDVLMTEPPSVDRIAPQTWRISMIGEEL